MPRNSKKIENDANAGTDVNQSGHPRARNNGAHESQKEVGRIVSFFSGVAKIQGLPHVFLHEVLKNEKGESAAIVIGFDEHFVDAIFFDENFPIDMPLFRSFKGFGVSLSEKYMGRIVDGFGRPLDDMGPISGEEASVFRAAPPIIDRAPVEEPLTTGIKIVDTAMPIGRGQRELIIGDRKLGKSSLAIDVVLNQAHAEPAIHCVYVLCGQKSDQLRDLIALFKKHNAFLYSTIVVAQASSSFTEQYLAPFVGCTIAEHFRDNGKHALAVYDDLSKHAKAYRSISLLLERAPGRETYPGDVFSLHAGLLERAAKLSPKKGGGSLTALPIIETQEDDITSFVPTNVISITDGQIYFSRDLFQSGFLPAVNIGLSVSRIGSQAQPKALAQAVKGIRLSLSQHQELEKISKLETHVSDKAERDIKRGNLLIECLKQKEHANVGWPEQVVLFYAINQGLLDDVPLEVAVDANMFVRDIAASRYAETMKKIRDGLFDDAIKAEIGGMIADFKRQFVK